MKNNCCLSTASERWSAWFSDGWRKGDLLIGFGLLLAVAVFVHAHDMAPYLSGAERAQRLQRNQHLIRALVHGGLLLAEEDDPLRRADHCNRVAEFLGKEMNQALDERENGRMEEFGHHLDLILLEGVVHNLTIARKSIPVGSHREMELLSVRNHFTHITLPLEERLQRYGLEEAQRARQTLSNRRNEVERAITWPHDPD